MEHWKQEIKRLDKLRLDLGLNWNRLASLCGRTRYQVQRVFEFKNEPGISLYFDIKIALENEIKVLYDKVESEQKESTIAAEQNVNDLLNSEERKSQYNESVDVKRSCDCHLVGNLFMIGKSGCKKSREEHKF